MALQEKEGLEAFFNEDEPLSIARLENLFSSFGTRKAEAVKAMADACRDERWRQPIREAGIPEYLLRLWDSQANPGDPFGRQVLRLVGNCCIADEPTQEIAARYLSKIAQSLAYKSENFDVAAGALCNIFSGEAASMAAAIESNVHELIAARLSKGQPITPENPVEAATLSFLALLVDSTLESGILTPASTSLDFISSMMTLTVLSTNTRDIHDEIFDSTLSLLRDEVVKANIAKYPASNHRALTAVEKAEFQPTSNPLVSLIVLYDVHAAELEGRQDSFDLEDDEEKPALDRVHELQSITSDIACLVKYNNAAELKTDDVILSLAKLFNWKSDQTEKLLSETFALLYLGNIARSAEICSALINDFTFHSQAFEILLNSKSKAAMHAAVGFLSNLATDNHNKKIIRDSKVIPHLCKADSPELLLMGVKLLRRLLKDSPENCRLVLMCREERNEESDGLVSMDDLEQRLGDVHRATEGPEAQCEIEAGRLLVTILRTLQLESATMDISAFMTNRLLHCLFNLVHRGSGTILLSEGLLGLALTSRSPVGAKLVYEGLQHEKPPFSLFDKVLDKPSSNQPNDNRNSALDAENALVILTQLSRNLAGDNEGVQILSDEFKDKFSDVLKEHMNSMQHSSMT